MSRSRSSRLRVLAAVLAAVVTSLTACGGGSDSLAAAKPAGNTIVVGSANFAENVLLAEMYAQALESKGFKVEKKLNVGSREVLYKAMKDGSVKRPSRVQRCAAVLARRQGHLDHDREPEDKNTIAVTQKTATANGLSTIADLAPLASS